jgi:mitochondrial fission protein ELM1
VGVLLGGDSGPYAFDESFAARLADQLNGLAAGKAAGNRVRLLITTSSRTPPGFLELLKSRLVAEYEAHAWGTAGENPYFGILAWADGLVVSADSIAMISEALATGKRVLLSEPTLGGSLRAAVYRSAMHWGHKRWTRDVALVHERLQKMGLIDWLPGGSVEPTAGAGVVGTAYLEDTAAKVKQLLD